jgi:hypothetical protein
MSRIFATVCIVVLVAGMIFVGYDIVNTKLGLPSIIGVFGSLWPDVTSGLGMAGRNSKGWIAIVIAGLVAFLLISRLPKYGRY